MIKEYWIKLQLELDQLKEEFYDRYESLDYNSLSKTELNRNISEVNRVMRSAYYKITNGDYSRKLYHGELTDPKIMYHREQELLNAEAFYSLILDYLWKIDEIIKKDS